jgi:Rieske Fe-S protein
MTDSSSLTSPAEGFGTGTTTRRAVLLGAAAIGVGSAVAACSSDPSPSGGTGTGASVTVNASDVPVGGGTILSDQQVVVTQPSQGVYKAFSAVCTHQGCLVGSVTNGQIVCPCHNSGFSAADGSVLFGPARASLAAVSLKKNGGTLTVG